MQAKSKIPFMYSKSKDKLCSPQDIANLFAKYYQDLYNLRDSEPSLFHRLHLSTFPSLLSFPISILPRPFFFLNQIISPLTTLGAIKKKNLSHFRKSRKSLTRPSCKNCRALMDFLTSTIVPLQIPSPHIFKLSVKAFFSGRTPPAAILQAIISSIPKFGKSSDNPDNFQPISLLNSDINFFF